MIQLWKCLHCNRINFSIPERPHEMNWCECGETAIDLETYGCRMIGNIEWLNELDYNFYSEVAYSMLEQGYLFPDGYLDNNMLSVARNIEDEIIKQYIEETL